MWPHSSAASTNALWSLKLLPELFTVTYPEKLCLAFPQNESLEPSMFRESSCLPKEADRVAGYSLNLKFANPSREFHYFYSLISCSGSNRPSPSSFHSSWRPDCARNLSGHDFLDVSFLYCTVGKMARFQVAEVGGGSHKSFASVLNPLMPQDLLLLCLLSAICPTAHAHTHIHSHTHTLTHTYTHTHTLHGNSQPNDGSRGWRERIYNISES